MRPFLWLVFAWAGMAMAQPLPDPTRPPAGAMPVAGSNGATDSFGGDGAVASGPQLQSVILRGGVKPRALIDGEWLELGQSIGDAKLVKIAPDRVELSGPQGKETLRLTPAVEKRQLLDPQSGVRKQEKKK